MQQRRYTALRHYSRYLTKAYARPLRQMLAVAYFVAMLLGASHFHHDLKSQHPECKICTLSQNLTGNDITDAVPVTAIPRPLFEMQSPAVLRQSVPVCKGFDAHAPPIFS
ncbi:MAG TPA: hypothetical protein ENK97_00770 [Campylobacteraceae bacterium]|nr:hypothetical protein [Campylobacteraceae bacterium]